MNIKSVTIYCASSTSVEQKYFDATEEIARILSEEKITVKYGGGANGLMGHLADTMLLHKGSIIGIMPHFMKQVEWNHKGVSEFIYVEDMAERKKLLMEEVDALIALPGGTGTLEELFEAITNKRLGQFTKPIIIFNQDGYYDPLVQMLDKMADEQFMRPIYKDMWTVITKPNELLDAIQNAPKWEATAINYAGL